MKNFPGFWMGAGWWCKADRALRRRKEVDLKELGMGEEYIKRGNRMERGETYLAMFIYQCLLPV